MPLPIASKIYRLAALHRKRGNAVHLINMKHADMIAAPAALQEVVRAVTAQE